MKKYFRRGNAILGFVNFGRNKEGRFGVHPVWGRLFLLFCALGVAAWIFVAFAGFLFLKHTRDIETGRFADLLLFRWDDYRLAWGEDYIERGKDLVEAGEAIEGFHYLRIGVGRSPGNIEGRLLLANLYLARNRVDLAARLLEDGMPYGIDDTDYVTATMRILLASEKDDQIRGIADEYLPEVPVLKDRNLILAFAAARANFHRGDFDRAVQLIDDYELSSSRNGRILLARIDWSRGRRAEAINRLETLAATHPDGNEAYIYLTRFHHEIGNLESAERYAVIRQLNDPLNMIPRVDLLYIYKEKGEHETLEYEIESILRDFRGDNRAVEHVAQFAMDTADVALAQRIFEHAQARSMELSIPGIILVHTLIKTGEFDRGIALAERLIREVEGFEDRFGPQILAVNAIAAYARRDQANGDLRLNQFLAGDNLRPSNYITYSDKLIEIAQIEPARRILVQAQRSNPRSQSLLNALIRLDMMRGDGIALIDNLPKLMDMRLPSPEVLNEAYLFLSSDRFLYTDDRREILEAIEAIMERHRTEAIG